METARQWIQDACDWAVALHDGPLAPEGMLDCVLHAANVRLASHFSLRSLCQSTALFWGEILTDILIRDGVPSKRRIVFWAAIVTPVTYVSCLFVAFLKCIPFERQWQINPEPPSQFNHQITRVAFKLIWMCLRCLHARHHLYTDALRDDTEHHYRLLPHGYPSAGKDRISSKHNR